MAVTIRDVAKLAGVSVGTVSNVINDTVPVSQETRRRVLAAIKQLDYHPSVVARSLQSQKTNTVGLIRPSTEHELHNPFFLGLLGGIGNEAAKHKVNLLISTCPPGSEEHSVYEEMVRGRQVDGLIVTSTRVKDERIAYLVREGFPFVAFGRTGQDLDFPYVDMDGTQGVYDSMQHLIDLGHRRIGYISASSELMCATHRLEGYRLALEKSHIELNESLIIEGNFTQQAGYRAMERLLALDPPPTAVFACNDLMALGAMGAAQERGLVVGRDISIVGFDDIQMAAHFRPPLTTIRQPAYDIGVMVCRMLLRIINKEKLAQDRIVLRPKLMVRQSTGTE